MPTPDFRATYRLQLGPDLSFAGARELVPYLAELGNSHLSVSPSLQALSLIQISEPS
jgi:(1->4)-alpha-D-glucan 1-alpha-D-glucosylmutase